MSFIWFAFPHIPQVRAVFQAGTTCVSGASWAGGNISLDVGDDPEAVLANRSSMFKAMGVEHWQELKQVHGVETLLDATGSDPERSGTVEADGSATRMPGLALAIKTADCQPILLAHHSGEIVAALHSGWRGNRAEYPARAVADLCTHYGVEPDEWSAVRGPSLSPARAEFIHFDREWGSDFTSYYHAESRTVDLWRMTRDQLMQAGLMPRNIYGLDLCTMSSPRFFSYRQDRECGRQASCIWIEPAI